MTYYYTNERNVQMLIYLMKQHNIRKVIASPGATNITFVASIQNDPFFQIYSSVDERSAAYMACGLAEESGEPVALSCTGATASRNYLPGLTEAFYRKLPILAITSSQHFAKVGHNVPQVIDRSTIQNDIAKLSVEIPLVKTEEDEWLYSDMINNALLELNHRGKGPVHINLMTSYSQKFNVQELPKTKVIKRIEHLDEFPILNLKRIAIFVGTHSQWSQRLRESVEEFCEKYNAVVLCDPTSNYNGKYRISANLLAYQDNYMSSNLSMDLLIDMGNTSGSYLGVSTKAVWRVNPDGELRDSFRKLTYIFEVREECFFDRYNSIKTEISDNSYHQDFLVECNNLKNKIPDLPFSNLWIANNLMDKIPDDAILHLGILNTLRTWGYIDSNPDLLSYSNTGGFGIDGCLSSLIGASLNNPNKLYFGVLGDLAFFYDLNSLGNRHIRNNLRILLINNGKGSEFTMYFHHGHKFGEKTNDYISAEGHYGNKSSLLIKNYSENLGFTYLTANDKETFIKSIEQFASSQTQEKPIVFEVFTDSFKESEAIKIIRNLNSSKKTEVKNILKKVLGENNTQKIKKIVQK